MARLLSLSGCPYSETSTDSDGVIDDLADYPSARDFRSHAILFVTAAAAGIEERQQRTSEFDDSCPSLGFREINRRKIQSHRNENRCGFGQHSRTRSSVRRD